MEELLRYVIENIVDKPDDIDITKDDSPYATTFTIKVATTDYGKIIGRSGRTINAIRTLLTVQAATASEAPLDKRIYLKIAEEDSSLNQA